MRPVQIFAEQGPAASKAGGAWPGTSMAVVKRITALPFRFGGEEHSGWLPPGAATPLPTPIEEVLLDVEIDSDASGFFLIWHSQDGTKCGDSWHETMAEAEAYAMKYFGIDRNRWS
jgi:hypothetical protein